MHQKDKDNKTAVNVSVYYTQLVTEVVDLSTLHPSSSFLHIPNFLTRHNDFCAKKKLVK